MILCSDLKEFANSQQKFLQSVEHFFLKLGQNKFRNKLQIVKYLGLFKLPWTLMIWYIGLTN